MTSNNSSLTVSLCSNLARLSLLKWKITWPLLIITSALKIVPLVAQVCCQGVVKCLDIALFLFILNQSGQSCESKKNNIFTVLNFFFKALNIRFWQFSQSFDSLNSRSWYNLLYSNVCSQWWSCFQWLPRKPVIVALIHTRAMAMFLHNNLFIMTLILISPRSSLKIVLYINILLEFVSQLS